MYMSTQNGYLPATFPCRDKEPKYISKSKKIIALMASDGPSPHPPSLPCALALPPPRHRDATAPSPCWFPHFMTQERLMLSNPTPSLSELHLSPAVTINDVMISAPTPPLHYASILQPATPPQIVAFVDSVPANPKMGINPFVAFGVRFLSMDLINDLILFSWGFTRNQSEPNGRCYALGRPCRFDFS